MFAAFRSRITRAYVLLALALVLGIAVTLSALSLMLFSRGAADSLAGASQRVTDAADAAMAHGATLEQAAPAIIRAARRSHFEIVVFDDRGRPIAQNEHGRPPAPSHAILVAIGDAIGFPRAHISVRGGTIEMMGDFDRLGQILLWYWEVTIPIAVAAMLIAWLVGRRITASAVGPLADVTKALRVIAGGDFAPQRLHEDSTELRDLTGAYNDVAHSLAAATAERERTTAQMRQFIADAGHELRTPLTVVMGYLDALQNGIVAGDGAQRTYGVMLEESRRMRTVIEKLILLARMDRPPASGAIRPVDLLEIAQRAMRAVEPLADGRISLIAPERETLVLGDESELAEAIKNLLDNSLKYAPDSHVQLGFTFPAGHVCAFVADRGPGMDETDARHAFDRFYRGGTREVEGSGLGLSIAKRAAERAGGTATLTSAPGAGTRVELCLPAAGKSAV